MSQVYSVRLQQVLHGYSDGHRMLAASTDLSRASRHAMLVLSDMSGRSMVPGFEEYLTGYPLEDSDMYALAKTWYAPEMERPGCVWTHTILMRPSDLARVVDLSEIAAKFVRPANPPSLERYEIPVEIRIGHQHRDGLADSRRDLLASIFWALYSMHGSVLLLNDDSRSFTDLVLALWSQQWPRLRASFAFCTGAISSRSVAGRPMDLQVIPYTASREVRRELPGALFVDRDEERLESDIEEWVQVAVEDLCDPTRRDLTTFLRLNGTTMYGRPDFRPLVELSLCSREFISPGTSLGDFVGAIATRYPLPSQATALKDRAVGIGAPLARGLGLVESESDVLLALSTVENGQAFDPIALLIDERCARLCADERAQAEILVVELLGKNHNAIGERVLTNLVSKMAMKELLALFRERPGGLVAAVRRDPELATITQVWQAAPHLHDELLGAAASRLVPSGDLARRIVVATLEAGARIEPARAVDCLGDAGVGPILDWYDVRVENQQVEMPSEWRRYLRRYPQAVIKWVNAFVRHPRSLANVARALDPHSVAVRSAGPAAWIKAVSANARMQETDKICLHAFGLALAHDLAEKSASELAVLTFETVHQAAAEGRLADDAWSFFDDSVPQLPV